jgi:hypothetical protein
MSNRSNTGIMVQTPVETRIAGPHIFCVTLFCVSGGIQIGLSRPKDPNSTYTYMYIQKLIVRKPDDVIREGEEGTGGGRGRHASNRSTLRLVIFFVRTK